MKLFCKIFIPLLFTFGWTVPFLASSEEPHPCDGREDEQHCTIRYRDCVNHYNAQHPYCQTIPDDYRTTEEVQRQERE